jgi:hypothetical protein
MPVRKFLTGIFFCEFTHIATLFTDVNYESKWGKQEINTLNPLLEGV